MLTYEAVQLCTAHAVAAARFYADVFDAREVVRVPRADGGLAHAELHLGAMVLIVADDAHQRQSLVPPARDVIRVAVDDAHAVACRAWDAGATVVCLGADEPGGSRQYLIRDPFGQAWALDNQTTDGKPDGRRRRQ
jgi:PhnB protein